MWSTLRTVSRKRYELQVDIDDERTREGGVMTWETEYVRRAGAVRGHACALYILTKVRYAIGIAACQRDDRRMEY